MESLLKNDEFFKLEFKISSKLRKEEVEKHLLELFEKLHVNHQVDLYSIEYICLKTSNIVQKIKLYFLNDKSRGKSFLTLISIKFYILNFICKKSCRFVLE